VPLYVRDAEVDRLVVQLAEKQHLSKTEVVREALRREWERVEREPSLVEKTAAFMRELDALWGEPKGLPADKAFIDSLYED
jgi:antitoxin VapB